MSSASRRPAWVARRPRPGRSSPGPEPHRGVGALPLRCQVMAGDGAASEPLHRALGLTDAEFGAVTGVLGREPNHLELALYAVMWSEHCSYKSSRRHLLRLPTEGPGVLV